MEKEQLQYAGFWVRLLAGFIDLIFMVPITLVIIYFLGGDLSNYDHNFGIDKSKSDLASYVVSIAYLTYFLSKKSQATIGKRILNIYVGNVDGSKLTWQKSLMRALAAMVTAMTLGLGFLLVIFN